MSFWTKSRDAFFRIWKDPVWSKVIAAGILLAIPILWAKITNHSWSDITNFAIAILSFKVPLFFFLSIIASYFLILKCVDLYKNKKDAFWDAEMGNYTFKELYNILLTETLPVETVGMSFSNQKAPDDNLLLLFRMYYSRLNVGFGLEDRLDDGGYLYGVFAPRMVGYGLVDEYQKPDSFVQGRTYSAYRTSLLGHKFHASIDKLIMKEKLRELKKNNVLKTKSKTLE